MIIFSSADVEGGSFKIPEGESETVTVTVTFDAATAGAAARLSSTHSSLVRLMVETLLQMVGSSSF